jgi:hypothetical protein
MKKIIFFLLFIVQSFSSFSQGQPYLLNDDCATSINRYLARSINMDYFSHHLLFDRAGYQAKVDMLAEVNASLIVRASTAWFQEDKFDRGIQSLMPGGTPIRPEGAMHKANKQMVMDINTAYDIKSLRRPIIQAGIFEGVNGGVNAIRIYPDVLSAFLNDPAVQMSEFDRTYYSTERNFFMPRMTFPCVSTPDCTCSATQWCNSELDITRIETQLWLYYQAIEHIDAGYKSLHMGIYWLYSRNDANYAILSRLLTKIRNYALSNNSFVIICGEVPMVDVVGGLVQTLNPLSNGLSARDANGSLIFDFDSRAMRIREIGFQGDTRSPLCTDPVGSNAFPSTGGCLQISSNLRGVVDPCVINGFGGSVGGTLPTGCGYVSQVPYIVHFDFGGSPIEPNSGLASNGPDSPCYGTSDTKYFSSLGSCRAEWWRKFYCERRDYHEGNGFIMAPGLLIDKPSTGPNWFDFSELAFSITDDPTLQTAVINTWQPRPSVQAETDIQVDLTLSQNLGCCGLKNAKRKMAHSYKISVSNPSCASYYTIHMKDPNGNWLPFTRGSVRNFQPTIDGTYTIFVKEDNLGITYDPNVTTTAQTPNWTAFGVRTKEFTRTFTSSGCYQTEGRINCKMLNFKGSDNNSEAFSVSPNPVSTQIDVSFYSEETENVSFKIFNSLGSNVLSRDEQISLGDNKFSLDIQNLTSGVYFITISGKNGISSQKKFVKQ